MPTPMFASIIMETSFAPSPIAIEIQELPYFFERFTTSAFYAGVTQQHITLDAVKPILKKVFSSSLFPRMQDKLLPLMTRTLLWDFRIFSLIFSSFTLLMFFGKSKSFYTISYSLSSIYVTDSICYSWVKFSSTLMIIMLKDSWMSLHDFPISIAVSCLSPVSTQTLISASMSLAIVSGTSS